MNRIQKIWLWVVIVTSLLHLVRDVFQSFEIDIWFATMFVKNPKTKPFLFNPINTYIVELVELILASYLLKNNIFGKLGYLTIAIALATFVGFVVYWLLY